MNHEPMPAQGPVDVNVRELSYSYTLLYDIKTLEQLQTEVEYLAHRLGGIASLCRDDGYSIDEYVLTAMKFPNAKLTGSGTESGCATGYASVETENRVLTCRQQKTKFQTGLTEAWRKRQRT